MRALDAHRCTVSEPHASQPEHFIFGLQTQRRRDFVGWQVDRRVMSLAKREAIFMHCLPAHRGEEVAAEVIDSKQSVIYDEAENRLHVQKAILVALMKERAR